MGIMRLFLEDLSVGGGMNCIVNVAFEWYVYVVRRRELGGGHVLSA